MAHNSPSQQIRTRIGRLMIERTELEIWKPKGYRTKLARVNTRIDHLRTKLEAGQS